MHKVYVKNADGQETVFIMELDSLDSMYLHRWFPDCVVKICKIPHNQDFHSKPNQAIFEGNIQNTDQTSNLIKIQNEKELFRDVTSKPEVVNTIQTISVEKSIDLNKQNKTTMIKKVSNTEQTGVRKIIQKKITENFTEEKKHTEFGDVISPVREKNSEIKLKLLEGVVKNELCRIETVTNTNNKNSTIKQNINNGNDLTRCILGIPNILPANYHCEGDEINSNIDKKINDLVSQIWNIINRIYKNKSILSQCNIISKFKGTINENQALMRTIIDDEKIVLGLIEKTDKIVEEIINQKVICESNSKAKITQIAGDTENTSKNEGENEIKFKENGLQNIANRNRNEVNTNIQDRPQKVEFLHCYICRVKIPVKYFALHEDSDTHKTLLQIHNECSLRMAEHVGNLQEPQIPKKNSCDILLEETFFCGICNDVIHIKFIDTHNESKNHKIFTTIEKILNHFLQILHQQNISFTTDSDKNNGNSVSNSLTDNKINNSNLGVADRQLKPENLCQYADGSRHAARDTLTNVNTVNSNLQNANEQDPGLSGRKCRINENDHKPGNSELITTNPYEVNETIKAHFNQGDPTITTLKSNTKSNEKSICYQAIDVDKQKRVNISNGNNSTYCSLCQSNLHNSTDHFSEHNHEINNKKNDAIIRELNRYTINDESDLKSVNGNIKKSPESSLNKTDKITDNKNQSHQLDNNKKVDPASSILFCKTCQIYVSDSLISKHNLGRAHITFEKIQSDSKKETKYNFENISDKRKKNKQCILNEAYQNLGFVINENNNNTSINKPKNLYINNTKHVYQTDESEREKYRLKDTVECSLNKTAENKGQRNIKSNKVNNYESEYSCDICQVNVPNDNNNINEHLSGLRHRANEKLLNENKKKTHNNENKSAQVQTSLTKNINVNMNYIFCDLCQAYCTSNLSYIEHISGRKHKIMEKTKNKPKDKTVSSVTIKDICKKTDDQANENLLNKNKKETHNNENKSAQVQTSSTKNINFNMNHIFCDLCQAYCNSNLSYIEHISGRKHKIMEKTKNKPKDKMVSSVTIKDICKKKDDQVINSKNTILSKLNYVSTTDEKKTHSSDEKYIIRDKKETKNAVTLEPNSFVKENCQLINTVKPVLIKSYKINDETTDENKSKVLKKTVCDTKTVISNLNDSTKRDIKETEKKNSLSNGPNKNSNLSNNYVGNNQTNNQSYNCKTVSGYSNDNKVVFKINEKTSKKENEIKSINENNSVIPQKKVVVNCNIERCLSNKIIEDNKYVKETYSEDLRDKLNKNTIIENKQLNSEKVKRNYIMKSSFKIGNKLKSENNNIKDLSNEKSNSTNNNTYIKDKFYCKICEIHVPNTDIDVSEHYLGVVHMTNEKNRIKL